MNTNAPDAKNGDGTTSQTHIRATEGGRGYRDAETLRRLYHDEGLSTTDIDERFDVDRSTITRCCEQELTAADIATRYDCSETTVYRRLDGVGIQRRGRRKALGRSHAALYTTANGDEMWVPGGEASHEPAVHQLLAIANGESAERMFSDGECQLHHKNHIPWDNRPENIELLSASEHARHHAAQSESETDH
jgi:DNA-binding transcriptional regulator LsrR (DeoR family)